MTPEEYVWSEYQRVVEPYVLPSGRLKAAAVMNLVIDMYSQPHRVYHTVGHLADVLRELTAWKRRLSAAEYLVAFAALVLHDAVYSIPPGDYSNEELSADLAGWFITSCGLSAVCDQSRVESAIEITEGHQPIDIVSLAVCWCDLAGFAKDTKTSERISQQIRDEYLSVYTIEQYEAGRRAFLTSYRSPFKTYLGASLHLKIRAFFLNRKANRQLDRELRELSIDSVQPTR
jgi:predicted metal-dependent HD superfamily phosphohydrolase